MKDLRGSRCACGMLVVLASLYACGYGQQLSVGEVIQRNLAAAGGQESIESIRTVSLEIEIAPSVTHRFFLSAFTEGNEKLKLLSGEPPIVQSVTVVHGDRVERKSFLPTPELTDMQRVEYSCYLKLFSGLFTLHNFRHDSLTLVGVKQFGAERSYVLTRSRAKIVTSLFVDSETFRLTRVVLENTQAEDGGYKLSLDFNPVSPVEGVNMPTGWIQSDAGTGALTYPVPYSFRNVKFNQQFEGDFFERLDLNMGTVTATIGTIRGNLTSSNYMESRRYVLMNTNITGGDVQRAGIKNGDALTVKVGGTEIPGSFFESSDASPAPPVVPGQAVLMKPIATQLHIIILFGEQFQSLHKSYRPLMEVSIVKR